MTKIPDDMKTNIVRLRKTHTPTQISAIIGYSPQTIGKVLRDRNASAKVGRTPLDRKAIKADFDNGFTNIYRLADKYNCNIFTMYRIIGEIKAQMPLQPPKGKTADIIHDIEQKSVTGEKYADIAKRYKVSRQYVYKLKNQIKGE